MSKVKNATSIGGQALIEGVMMRGPENVGIAVRKPDGSIETKTLTVGTIKDKYPILKLPIVRGVVNFIEMMMFGYKALAYSADVAGQGIEEEPSKFEVWLSKKFGKSLMDVAMYLALILGVVIAVGLFSVLPTLITGIFGNILPQNGKTAIEAILKFAIFIVYIILASRLKDIKRVFQYHGAEHKTIFCYEAKKELTVENARSFGRLHPRCGTNFIAIVLLVSIFIFSFVSWNSVLIRVLLKIALLPIVVGISYELLKLAGRYDNILTRIISFPGMMLQKITTQEPDDSMLEIAIKAVKLVLPEDGGIVQW
ncbi:MAG: DUF1385 domain-containing protein [Bacillota bacterium]|nr:DUF1385 domain-containing protein [Bacillota bacterium]